MRKLLGRLANKGCNLRLILTYIQLYTRNPGSLSDARKARGRAFRSIVNRDCNRMGRDGSLAPESARAIRRLLLARAETAFDAKRMGVARETAFLAMLEYYVEVKTGTRPSTSDLAFLIEAGRMALGRKHPDVSREVVRRELARFKKRNPVLIPLIHAQVDRTITGTSY